MSLSWVLDTTMVEASDIAGALAQVEPPYPGYRRTLPAFQTYIELAKEDNSETTAAIRCAQGDDFTGRYLAGCPTAHGLNRLAGDLPADALLPVG
jgi:hypothetical protein